MNIEGPTKPAFVELISFFAALAILACVQIAGARALDLFSHPLWLDECFTSLLANDKSFSHMLSAIAAGVDTNPPTLYLILWPIARVLGTMNEVALRIIALIWMLAAVTGLYAICRRFFGRGPSAVAALAVWAHPLIIDHAFEARFYGPWLALTVWFCYLQLDASAKQSSARRVARYILGIGATSIHYFGVIAMLLIAAGDLLAHRRIKRLGPFVAGLAVVALCTPLLLKQRAGLSIATWIEPFTISEFKADLVAVFGAPSLLVTALVIWVWYVFTPTQRTQSDDPASDYRQLIPLSSLLLMPVAVAAISIVAQPALVLRYLILSIAPLAPPMAALAQRSSRPVIVLLMIILSGLGVVSIVGKSRATRGLDNEFRVAIAEIDRRVPSDGLIVFKRRREMYPILHMRPDLVSRSAQLEFDDSVLPDVTRMSRYERDMGRKVQHTYPWLRTAKRDELTEKNVFYVVAPVDEFRELQRQLPGFRVGDPESVLHEVRKVP